MHNKMTIKKIQIADTIPLTLSVVSNNKKCQRETTLLSLLPYFVLGKKVINISHCWISIVSP